ncbi:hypothetical protein [Sphaerospermopsis sp. LEGE 08334]|uniref:hypothetical protein n=1 Tax=Sphaerospermopsis sp. LEGE 08334 TaxID=1828651 RepID=UPI00187E2EBB|nr:hypothetical protein [Sphaerospermopsis sp. LEGE 08334]MBE9055412.1 hypothetical protein [Sphaerospermopsis sp. LEGE 08334]
MNQNECGSFIKLDNKIMKIYQLIFQGCALVLLTALPSFAETKNKVILVPGENLFPLKCETIQGSIDANDKVAPRGSLNDNFESRYDSYSVKIQPRNIMFIELTTPNSDYSNFNPKLTTQMVDKKTGTKLLDTASKGGILPGQKEKQPPRFAWYFKDESITKITNWNIYISAPNSGNYNLKIAFARPSSNLSESEIDEAISDSSIDGAARLLSTLIVKLSAGASLTLNDDEKIHPVDMNALCKN